MVELLRGAQERAEGQRAGLLNDDGDVAVEVDYRGGLTKIWLKPGVMDGKRPAKIASEITTLLAAAGDQALESSRQMVTDAMKIVPTLVADLPDESDYFPAGRLDGGRV